MRGREGRCGTIPHPLNLLNPHPLTSLLSLANTPSSPKLPFPHLTENVCSSNEFQTSHKHLSGGVRQGGGGGEKGVGREEVEWEEEEGVGEWEFPRPSPSIFAYCKQSKPGGVEGLGIE